MKEDFYDILEVSKSASSSDIKRAYRNLARKYHPDNKETGDEEMFKKVGEAYSVLSDDQKRAVYDRVGHSAFKAGGGGSSGFAGGDVDFGFESVFTQFEDLLEGFFDPGFGGGRRRGGSSNGGRRAERGADLLADLQIEFLEAAFGTEKKIKIARQATCEACKGTGSDPEHPPSACYTCNGTGEVKKSVRSFLGTITQVMTCPTCNGRGVVITHPCKTCKGRGLSTQEEELSIKIPAGIESETRILWSGKGNGGANGGNSGDLYVRILVKSHEKFVRDGLDIASHVDINVWKAIKGGSLSVGTIHGEEIMNLKSGVQSGETLRLSGKGINLENGKKGDHYVKVNVLIPKEQDLPENLRNLIDEKYAGE